MRHAGVMGRGWRRCGRGRNSGRNQNHNYRRVKGKRRGGGKMSDVRESVSLSASGDTKTCAELRRCSVCRGAVYCSKVGRCRLT